MVHKTFISYKYSEAKNLRNRIIRHLGVDQTKYYQGETSESPNLTNEKTESIRHLLKEMIYDTSVMIVIISPNMKQSNWIDWEIEYALKSIKHGDHTSHSNGVVGVIMNDPDESWFRYTEKKPDGDMCYAYHSEYACEIINANRCNQKPKQYACETCGTVDSLTGSYISFVTEDNFISDPKRYIDNAFDKSCKIDEYEITKHIDKNHIATL